MNVADLLMHAAGQALHCTRIGLCYQPAPDDSSRQQGLPGTSCRRLHGAGAADGSGGVGGAQHAAHGLWQGSQQSDVHVQVLSIIRDVCSGGAINLGSVGV